MTAKPLGGGILGVTVCVLFLALNAAAQELNVAPLGTATQSSEGWGGVPQRAIDGNTSGQWGDNSITHTSEDPMDAAPWWQVDLGDVYSISRVTLWNRADCCWQRLSNFHIAILDDAAAEVWGADLLTDLSYPDPALGGYDIIPDDAPIDGQTVRIDILGPCSTGVTILSLAEVQVFTESPPLAIIQQPLGARVYPGRSFSTSVQVLDGTGVTFQWKKEGADIDGATSSTFAICSVATGDAGSYTVVAKRGAETVTSDPAVLEVVDGNLAVHGQAMQSTTGYGGGPERAIDGNSDGVFGNNSVTHTNDGDTDPWWQVSLRGVSTIDRILIWGRTDDCCIARLTNFRVSVLDESQSEVFGEDFYTDGVTYPDTHTEGFEVMPPADTSGKYVRVALLPQPTPGTPPFLLSLAEVEVFGTGPTGPWPADGNLARGKLTNQTSTQAPYVSVLGVDGDLGNFTHTSSAADTAPAWEVDLCGMQDIESIVLYNRTSCCGSRLRDITVSVLDATKTTTLFESELLNPENELGTFPNGPPTLTVDFTGQPIQGAFVRVSRTADEDFSGGGDGTNLDEAYVLSLAEVQVLAPAQCPPQGDTHCEGITIDGPAGNAPGVYTLTASAADDSGDPISYTFTVDNGVLPARVIGPTGNNVLTGIVGVGTWTVTVLVDDTARCPDVAADATCSQQVVVTGDPANLALKGEATQSSLAWDGHPSLAIDGITDGVYGNGSITHTAEGGVDTAPWWQVDLGQTYELGEIVLWNRVDCCSNRLSNFRVSVLDSAAAVVWSELFFTDLTYPDTTAEGYLITIPEGTSGQVVKIEIAGPNAEGLTILSLAEVQVFGGGTVMPKFHRGDANGDGAINITDGIYVLNFLFLGGPAPSCREAANPNDDASINITDGIYILNYLFLGGPKPATPGPIDLPCGPDPAGSPTSLGCDSYTKCP